MIVVSVNLIAVIIAAVLSFGIGILQYSPLLFAKPWVQASDLNEKKLKATKGTKMAQTMFVAPVQLGSILWEQKPAEFFLINTAHKRVNLLTMGAILAAWM